jgi:hypothetical protein
MKITDLGFRFLTEPGPGTLKDLEGVTIENVEQILTGREACIPAVKLLTELEIHLVQVNVTVAGAARKAGSSQPFLTLAKIEKIDQASADKLSPTINKIFAQADVKFKVMAEAEPIKFDFKDEDAFKKAFQVFGEGEEEAARPIVRDADKKLTATGQKLFAFQNADGHKFRIHIFFFDEIPDTTGLTINLTDVKGPPEEALIVASKRAFRKLREQSELHSMAETISHELTHVLRVARDFVVGDTKAFEDFWLGPKFKEGLRGLGEEARVKRIGDEFLSNLMIDAKARLGTNLTEIQIEKIQTAAKGLAEKKK